jgi:hypothetical protein
MQRVQFPKLLSAICALTILTLPIGAATPPVVLNAPETFPAGQAPTSVAVGDFDNDGIADLAITNGGYGGNTVTLLQGNGKGLFRPFVSYTVGSEPQFITTGDFNKDGNVDLVVANYASNTVSIMLV